MPGKLELTIPLTRVMLPFLTLVALAAAVMGMLNSLHHYFVPALAPADVQRRDDRRARSLLVPADAGARAAAHHGDRDRARSSAASGRSRVQWPPLRREGFRYAAVLDLRDPGLRQVLLLMGPGTHRPGGDAGQPVRQHAARDEPGHGRRVVAAVRVPADVSADRPVRRVDRHGGAAGGLRATRRSRRSDGDPRDRVARAGADADASTCRRRSG